jgi:GH18 family chitinase
MLGLRVGCHVKLISLHSQPSCKSTTEVEQYDRRIRYYEIFGLKRACDRVYPEDLAVGPLTHLNLAFMLFDSDFNIIDDSGDIVRRTSFLKTRFPGLRVNAAIGGWAFNDPPTQNYFSNMASTHPNRQKFISSLIDYLEKYGLDGVDINWEYPAALDRGGRPEDTNNFVFLLSEIREAFDRHNPGWEATITIPTSYWYLRGFDLPGLQKYVSYFNLMSYDLYGG